MQISEIVERIPGVQPIASLSGAWKWSPAPGVNFAAALTADGDKIFRINVMGGVGESLIAPVLSFARVHGLESRLDGSVQAILDGFAHPGYDFDTVAAVKPEIHGYHAREHSELQNLSIGVFPAYRCEFSGHESEEEVSVRFKRMLHPANLSRAASPYLKMSYQNTRTRGGSTGPGRGFTTLKVLQRELKLLESADDSFVEFENYEERVFRVHWDGRLVLSEGQDSVVTELAALLPWTEKVLTTSGIPLLGDGT